MKKTNTRRPGGTQLRLVRETEYRPPERETRGAERGGKGIYLLIAGLALLALAGLAGLFWYLATRYAVTTVYVEGSVHYTSEEIQDIVMSGPLGRNSLFLSLKYKDREVEGIPFVQTMDVSILSPDTIRITVYEKALAGYVEYLGKYLYFDKDGIVVESSDTRTEGIPQVTGLSFGYVVLHEKLPVEDADIFDEILNITQLLTKYGVSADRIYFDPNRSITLYFGDIRVRVGEEAGLDEKIMRLQAVLPQLAGRSGVIEMENFTEDSRNFTLSPD